MMALPIFYEDGIPQRYSRITALSNSDDEMTALTDIDDEVTTLAGVIDVMMAPLDRWHFRMCMTR